MTKSPYQDLPKTSFWSSGVRSPVESQNTLAIAPLLGSLSEEDTIVSGGSCFAQYIGRELLSRNRRHLRSALSGARTESFGIGNIYSVAQLRQWLEFALGKREWADDTVLESEGRYLDYLLPHGDAKSSRTEVTRHRERIAEEAVRHLAAADLFIFTVGLTETWRNGQGDVLPACPGTLIGRFDESAHVFSNSSFEDISRDLEAVDDLLQEINPTIRMALTVSPVPLTATASAEHVLIANSYSKAVIRAAVGQFCSASDRASYFPSYELITHQTELDWRFEKNLRSVSRSGVDYVMSHAFGEGRRHLETKRVNVPADCAASYDEAICEEEMLDAYARSHDEPDSVPGLFIIGDSHMQKLARGFENIGVPAVGGQVMNGSGFTQNKFELSEDKIFIPTESAESRDIWLEIFDKLRARTTPCNIITNIGFQTHRTINTICNHFKTPVLISDQVSEYFRTHYASQTCILRELARYGKVWFVEDPNFNAFLSDKDVGVMTRDKNFHRYCQHLREVAEEMNAEYLAPSDLVLHRHFAETSNFNDLVAADGYHGTQMYYDRCALIVNASIEPTSRAHPCQPGFHVSDPPANA